MSGPLRPSEELVVQVIETLRSQFPTCRIFLSTWTESELVRSKVDMYQVVREPTHQEITQSVGARTIQQKQLGLSDETPGCKFSTYKMLYGVQNVCQLASPFVKDTDKVIRIRTDSIFQFNPKYLESLLNLDGNVYVAKKGDGFDWFALSSFSNIKDTWCFRNLQEYNDNVSNSWNAEDVVKRRVRVPVQYLDTTKVDAYILRENGRKHYYA